MRKTTDKKDFYAALAVTALTVLFMLLLAGVMLTETGWNETGVFGRGTLLFCVGVCLAVAVGVAAALVQRWNEIRGGEEDEAKHY